MEKYYLDWSELTRRVYITNGKNKIDVTELYEKIVAERERLKTPLNGDNKMERLVELTKRHKIQMDEKNVLISVYTNASGFLWSMMKVDSGTNLGWSEYNGDCEMSGTFTSYEDALEDALNLVAKCDLKKFKKDCPNDKFHWGNYAGWLSKHYR